MATQPKRILVGYDASVGARRALDAAAELMGYGSTLTVVSVGEKDGAAVRALDSARETLLAQLITATYVERRGEPADEIVGTADELGVDVIVVGRRGPGESNGRAPGSVSADVVRRAHCDVLVVG